VFNATFRDSFLAFIVIDWYTNSIVLHKILVIFLF